MLRVVVSACLHSLSSTQVIFRVTALAVLSYPCLAKAGYLQVTPCCSLSLCEMSSQAAVGAKAHLSRKSLAAVSHIAIPAGVYGW